MAFESIPPMVLGKSQQRAQSLMGDQDLQTMNAMNFFGKEWERVEIGRFRQMDRTVQTAHTVARLIASFYGGPIGSMAADATLFDPLEGDPYKGMYEPIEWDLRFWTDSKYKDTSVYKLIDKVRLNPILEYERDQVAFSLMIGNKLSVKNILDKLDKYEIMQEKDLETDIYRDHGWIHKLFPTWVSKPFAMREYKNSLN